MRECGHIAFQSGRGGGFPADRLKFNISTRKTAKYIIRIAKIQVSPRLHSPEQLYLTQFHIGTASLS